MFVTSSDLVGFPCARLGLLQAVTRADLACPRLHEASGEPDQPGARYAITVASQIRLPSEDPSARPEAAGSSTEEIGR